MNTMENLGHLLIKDLNNGLIMRHARKEDAQALADFNGKIHAQPPEERSEFVYHWVLDLASKPHPTFDVSDFIIIEETESGRIVSSLNLINQTWTYGGIKFEVGRPELVGTLKEYRRKGLVCEMFEIIHKMSDERGRLMQAITGIPWYYRLFGYDMALNLGGSGIVYKSSIPKLKKEETEQFNIRLAEEKDIPLIMSLYDAFCERSLVACEWDQEMWRYELITRTPAYKTCIVEDLEGNPGGFFTHVSTVYGPRLGISLIEILDNACWLDVAPGIMRYLCKVGEEISAQKKGADFEFLAFELGEEHPLYEAIPNTFAKHNKPYAWFIRIPDLTGFLNLIKPVLEERLANSVARNFSGEITLSYYRSGHKLTFEKGRIKNIEDWKPELAGDGDALFPDLTFYQLLLGYRSLKEMDNHYADCYVNKKEKWAVINALFPKQATCVIPVF